MSSEFNEYTTHDLWAEARELKIVSTRLSETSMKITVTRPVGQTIISGAVITLGESQQSVDSYPSDEQQYTASTVFGDPTASVIGNSQVVGFWSATLMNPLPDVSTDTKSISFDIVVTELSPSKAYFASVHGASNVFQYYPMGVQAFPLDAAKVAKHPASYAGSLPSLPSPPTNPSNGMVYFDKTLNVVQYWDRVKQIWIPTRADTIISGEVNPGSIGQAFLIGGNRLNVFSGKRWEVASELNMQVKTFDGQWAPFLSIVGSTAHPEPAVGQFYYSYNTERPEYWDGQNWVTPTPSNTLFITSVGMIQVFTTPFTVEHDELPNPYNGLLFYNTKQKVLNVWDVDRWIVANTDQVGTASTDKIGIGTDGSYDARVRLIKVLKAQLGWPVQCVELTEDQINIGIDNALDTFRQLSAQAYERRFILFTMMKNQQVYFLNSPIDQTDRVVTVHKVYRLNSLGFTSTANNWDANVFLQNFATFYYSTNYVDLLSIHLMANLQEEMHRIFAGEYIFTWAEARRELCVTRRISKDEKVVLEVFLEKSEQEIMQDRFAKQFIQGWAIAECKEMLGLIRSKFTNGTPGPSGNITLNGDTLLNEARTDFTEWTQKLLDWEHQSAELGNVSFLLG